MTPSQISCLQLASYILVAGTQDGALNFWDLRETGFSHQKHFNRYGVALSQILKNEDNATFTFRFPSYSSEYSISAYNISADFDENQNQYSHQSPVIKILPNAANKKIIELFSLEEFGSIIQWDILDMQKEEQERNFVEYGNFTKLSIVQPSKINIQSLMPAHEELICYDLDFDPADNYLYVSTNAGVIKASASGSANAVKAPRLYNDRSEYSFPICVSAGAYESTFLTGQSNGSILIYLKSCSHPIIQIPQFSSSAIKQIHTLNV